MFWILRRTQLSGAANFFNNINNNSSNNSNNNTDRKGYNKLSGCDEPEVTSAPYTSTASKCCVTNGNTTPPTMNTSLVVDSSDSESNSNYTDLDLEHLSDDSDYDEALTCNVCDRSFATLRHLARHQQKKRHFGCSACDSLFPSLMALEHHKEEFEHWSGDESCDEASQSGDDTSQDTVTSEEMERLL